MGRFLIIAGIILVVVGILVSYGTFSFLRLGRLPGDIVVKRENWSFYFPLTTSIVLSVVLTVLLYLLRK